MASGPAENPLVERILTASGRVVLLTGPAASGKTAAALATYRSFLDADGRSRCLLLAPNAPAVALLRRRLLEQSPHGVIVAPGVLLFAGLAGRILAAPRSDSSPADDGDARAMPAFERDLVLRRIVNELNAAGELTALSAVADTPGLTATLDRAIAELKRAAIDPDDLAKAVGRREGKNRDLLAVYRAYQQHLLESRTFDVEGQMWLARDRLRACPPGAPPPGLDGIEAIAVDGFTDFTPTQLEMLALLSAHVRRVLITLCLVDDRRERMWHWTGRTRDRIRGAMADKLQEIATDRVAAPPMAPLWGRLFDLDAEPCEAPPGLHLIAASGLDAEVSAVARRIKRLLLAGAPGGTVAVTARSLDAYRPAIERIFAEHEIPLAPAPGALTDCGIVRFLLDAADLPPDFAFRHVLRVIKNSYFRPQALGEFDGATVATAEMLIREGNVLGGRETYAKAADRLAARIAAQATAADDDQPLCLGPVRTSPEAIASAAGMLEALFSLAQSTHAQSPPADLASGLLRLLEALDLQGVACDHGEAPLVARDLRALAALRSALATVCEPVARPADLREALSCVSCPPARGESMVDCLDVLDARPLRYRHLFCLGLCEGRFPHRLAERSLLGEADRRAWAHRGLALDRRADLAAREMFLFYLAVSRPDVSLTLSWLDADAAGAPGAPSSFLLSLLEPIGGLDHAGVERIPPGRFLPHSDDLASGRDAFNAAVAGLFDEDLCRPDEALVWARDHAAERVARAAAGIWARERRWQRGEPNAFDGRLTDASLLRVLARRYPAEVVFSASRLNAYGQCPWQYFARYVLHLAPLGEPQRRLEATARGGFIHGVLCRVLHDLRETAGGPLRLAEIDPPALHDALDRAVAAESDAVEARSVPYPVLWDIQRRQMHADVLDYLEACRVGDALQPACLHFELSFGAEADAAQRLDPAGTPEPVDLDTPAGKIRVQGKIDRVDRVSFGGADGLLVVDYKTGRLPTQADITDGRSLQLPIYAAAAGALLGAASFGGAFHRIGASARSARQFFAAMKCTRGRYAAVGDFDERRRSVFETIGRFVRGMRDGRFDLAPTHDCPSYCPYRQVCHFSPARAEVKAAGGGGEADGEGAA